MTEIHALHQEPYLQMLCQLEPNPQINQRAFRYQPGEPNLCLTALLDKGLLEAKNLQCSKRKLACAYQLTPAGIAEITSLAD